MKNEDSLHCTYQTNLRRQFFQFFSVRGWTVLALLVAAAIGLLAYPRLQSAQSGRPLRDAQPPVGATEVPSATAEGSAKDQWSPLTREKADLPSKRLGLTPSTSSVSHRLNALTAEEALPKAANQIGVVRAVNYNSRSLGQTFKTSNVGTVRLITLQSPGALEMRVHLADFDLPPGDEVYVYGLDKKSPVAGPYARRGPLAGLTSVRGPQNFWSDTIPGDTVIVEHFSPGEEHAFTISQVTHNYKSFLAQPHPLLLGCHADANCTNDNNNNAVARITYVGYPGAYQCSGTMLNDLAAGELAPYLITSRSCLRSLGDADSAQALWFYRSTFCNSGVAATGIPSPAGATLLANEQSSDQALLRILFQVPSNLTYSGWNAGAQTTATSVVGLHHPDGSYLRRSTGTITNTATSCGGSGVTNGYRVDWNSGTTEAGSSGSGLFLTNGQLTGVHSCYYCTLQPDGSCTPACTKDATYGKLSDFYDNISSYLTYGDYGAVPQLPYPRPEFTFTRNVTTSSPPSPVRGVGFYGDSYGNFMGVKGQRISIKINSATDTVAYLLAPGQRRLISHDDQNGPGNNPQIDVVLPETGEYLLHVTSWVGGITFTYSAEVNIIPPKADFDFDNLTDVSIWRPTDGMWWIYNSSNNTYRVNQWGVSGDLPVAGDYDGDNKADIAVFRPGNGTWWIYQSLTNTYITRQWGAISDVLVPGDYDGDTKTDIAIWRPLDGMWWVYNLATNTYFTQQWGLNGDIPVPGDYDADGKTDIAIWRPSNGTWWIRNSAYGIRELFPVPLYRTVQWGINGDKPVPGDYDGDGQTDLAVWRPSTGVWWIYNLKTNTYTSRQWGYSTDIPVPGNYDGDGKTDIAIWRPGDGMWWITTSANNSYRIQQWGVNGDIPIPSK